MATNRYSLSCSPPPPPPPEGLLDDVLSFYQTLPPASSLSSSTGVSAGGSRASACTSLLPSSSPSPSCSYSIESSESEEDQLLDESEEDQLLDESEEDQLLDESEQLLRILDAAIASPSSRSSPLSGNDGNARVTPVNGVASVALVTHSDRTATAAAAAQTVREHEGANLQITRSATKPNRHREKMKREAEYLRNRVRELESELKVLRQGGMTASTRLENNATMNAAWERIAKSQLGLRMASEAENRRLKRELRLHLEMTNSLAQTLGKRLSSSSSLQSVAPLQRKRGRSTKGDAGFFQDLVDDLDAAFGRLDGVFKSNGLGKVVTELRHAVRTRPIRDSGGAGVTQFVEMYDAQVSPFATWVTANASWESTAKQFATRKYSEVERVWRSKDVIASAFCMQGQAPLRGRVAVKKYFDNPHRLVLVWRGHTSCVGGFSEYIADETGWAVFEHLSSNPGQGSDGSIVRTCVQFVQHQQSSVAGAVGLKPAEVDRFTDMILSWHEETMTELSKVMENMLLDDVMGATGGGAGLFN